MEFGFVEFEPGDSFEATVVSDLTVVLTALGEYRFGVIGFLHREHSNEDHDKLEFFKLTHARDIPQKGSRVRVRALQDVDPSGPVLFIDPDPPEEGED